jgi:hypothetical protein
MTAAKGFRASARPPSALRTPLFARLSRQITTQKSVFSAVRSTGLIEPTVRTWTISFSRMGILVTRSERAPRKGRNHNFYPISKFLLLA